MALQYVGARGQVVKTGRASGAASRYGWTFDVNDKDVDRIRRKFERASGRSLYTRLQRATLASGDLLAGRAKQAAPRGPTGNLRRSIKARPERRKGVLGVTLRGRGAGGSTTVLIGPTHRRAPHRHLIILGTGNRPAVGGRPSSPYRAWGGRVYRREAIGMVGRMKPNPFMDRAARGFGPKASALVMREWKTLLR